MPDAAAELTVERVLCAVECIPTGRVVSYGDLGFQGVAISDDLGEAAAVGNVKPGDRAVRFFAAGGDLLINADPALMDEMLKATIAWAVENPGNADRLAESAGRVLALKESAGLLTCG